MDIKEIIFTDGQIISYQIENDNLIFNFLNYANERVKIIFQGNINFEDNEIVGAEFADYNLSNKNNQQELLLLDDTKNIKFKIVFDKASYQFEND